MLTRTAAHALAMIAFVAAASVAQMPRPTSPDITAHDVRTRTYIIADDAMEGRDTGKRGGLRSAVVIPKLGFALALGLGGQPFGGGFHGDNVATIYGGRVGDSTIAPDLTRDKVVVFAAPTFAFWQRDNLRRYAGARGFATRTSRSARITTTSAWDRRWIMTRFARSTRSCAFEAPTIRHRPR